MPRVVIHGGMSYRSPRPLFAALVFAAAGWLGGAIITATGGLAGLPSALVGIEAIRAGLLAAGMGGLLSVPMRRVRTMPVSIGIWILLAAATVVLVTWLYFTIWPPQWEAPAYKIAGLCLKGYWKHLLPLALAAGGLNGWLGSRLGPVPGDEAMG